MPALTKSASFSYVQARCFTAPPAAEPQRPTTLRHVIYYDIRDVLVWQYKRTRVFFVVAGVLGACAASYIWQKQGPNSGKTNILHALEHGAESGTWPEDASAAVKRADLHKQLVLLLRPQNTLQYAVVMGARGTGKSTAIRQAARDSGADGVNGVVYYLVDYPTNFSTGLAALLGCREATVDVTGGIQRLLSQVTKEAKLPAAKDEPRATWMQLYPQLLEGATAFRQAHGRPRHATGLCKERRGRWCNASSFCVFRWRRPCADGIALRVVTFGRSGGSGRHLRQRGSEFPRGRKKGEARRGRCVSCKTGLVLCEPATYLPVQPSRLIASLEVALSCWCATPRCRMSLRSCPR